MNAAGIESKSVKESGRVRGRTADFPGRVDAVGGTVRPAKRTYVVSGGVDGAVRRGSKAVSIPAGKVGKTDHLSGIIDAENVGVCATQGAEVEHDVIGLRQQRER